MKATLRTINNGLAFVLVAEDGQEQAFQSEWDYPSIASTFGWAPCHPETDGTIDCRSCGKSAEWLIWDAYEYLWDFVGESCEDPGYFA